MKSKTSLNKNMLTDSEIKDAYLFEKALADKLKAASREERRDLYNSVYAQYYKKYPKHPFIERDEQEIKRSTALQLNYFKDFLRPDLVFLEIGPGTGAVTVETSKYVKSVYALDVSDSVLINSKLPSNVKIVIYDGVNIPGSIKGVHIVYSSQVMEHLHQDDAQEQLNSIYDTLFTEGIFICRTPHRYSGPHDISKHFDDVSTCFHLKEYTVRELVRMFKLAGFNKVKYEIVPKGKRVPVPLFVITTIEMVLGVLPISLKRKLAGNLPLRPLFNYCIIGKK